MALREPSVLALATVPFLLATLVPSRAVAQASAALVTSDKPDSLAFGAIGDSVVQRTIKGVTVRSSSPRTSEVRLAVSNLENADGQVLSAADWLEVRPDQGSVSDKRPFAFDVTLRTPQRVSSEIANGAYTARVRIESPDISAPIEIPVEVTVDVPSVTLDEQVASAGLQAGIWCCVPGRDRARLWIGSTSGSPQTVRVQVSPTLEDAAGVAVDPTKLSVAIMAPTAGILELAPSTSHEDVAIPLALEFRALSPHLAAGEYRGALYLDGDRIRDRRVPLVVRLHAPTFDRRLRMIALAGTATALLGFVLAGIFLHRNRPYFQGSEVNLEFGDEQRQMFRDLFTISRARAHGRVGYHISTTRASATALDGRPIVRGNDALMPGRTISSRDDTGEYELAVDYLDDYVVTLSLLRSPYSALRYWLGAGTALLALLVSGLFTVSPGILCRLAGQYLP